MALLLLQDKLTNAIDNGEYAIGLFLDLSKTFDTIDHKILADKLKFYGIREVVLKWFEIYLSNKKQVVSFNGTISEEMTITCGVPQGSILGQLLFLLYINDLALTFDKLRAVLFADDTNLFITGKNLHQITEIMNTELIKVRIMSNAYYLAHTSELVLNHKILKLDQINILPFVPLTCFYGKK